MHYCISLAVTYGDLKIGLLKICLKINKKRWLFGWYSTISLLQASAAGLNKRL
jgi:hypothetical protein